MYHHDLKLVMIRIIVCLQGGDQVEHGKQGEVAGPAAKESHKDKGVAVRFPGNKRTIICHLNSVRRRRRHAATHSSPSPQLPLLSAHDTHYECRVWAHVQVSRQPPSPLPSGYTVGEHVYFTGTSETFENGDQVEHGKQGEVVGPYHHEL